VVALFAKNKVRFAHAEQLWSKCYVTITSRYFNSAFICRDLFYHWQTCHCLPGRFHR